MENLVKLLPVIAVVALVVIIFLLGYVKAPPDVAYIISGIRKRPRVLIGRAGIRIPFLERVDTRGSYTVHQRIDNGSHVISLRSSQSTR